MALISTRTAQKLSAAFLVPREIAEREMSCGFSCVRLATFSFFCSSTFAQKQSRLLTVHRVGVRPRTIFLHCFNNARDLANQMALQVHLKANCLAPFG